MVYTVSGFSIKILEEARAEFEAAKMATAYITVFTICIWTDRQNQASHHCVHCLPLIQQFLDIALGGKLYLFKFYNKYDKELRCPNTLGK